MVENGFQGRGQLDDRVIWTWTERASGANVKQQTPQQSDSREEEGIPEAFAHRRSTADFAEGAIPTMSDNR
jgi:hypothetical protein